MRTTGERIAPASVCRIEHFCQAIAANRQVMPDHGGKPAAAIIEDIKIVGNAPERTIQRLYRIDARRDRSVHSKALNQALHLLSGATDFYLNAMRVFLDPTGKQKLFGQPPDIRSKPTPCATPLSQIR